MDQAHKWMNRILGTGRLVLCLVLLGVVAVVLLRLLGHQLPVLRVSEANGQNLGILIAAMAYALNALR